MKDHVLVWVKIRDVEESDWVKIIYETNEGEYGRKGIFQSIRKGEEPLI